MMIQINIVIVASSAQSAPKTLWLAPSFVVVYPNPNAALHLTRGSCRNVTIRRNYQILDYRRMHALTSASFSTLTPDFQTFTAIFNYVGYGLDTGPILFSFAGCLENKSTHYRTIVSGNLYKSKQNYGVESNAVFLIRCAVCYFLAVNRFFCAGQCTCSTQLMPVFQHSATQPNATQRTAATVPHSPATRNVPQRRSHGGINFIPPWPQRPA